MLIISTSLPSSANFPVNGTYTSLSSGVQESYSQFDDQVVLVEGMATWCDPCRQEFNELSQIRDVYGSNITIFSLSVSPSTDNLQNIRIFKEEAESAFGFTADWEFGLDQDGDFSDYFDISLVPTTVLIDSNGTLIKRWEGPVFAANISSYINANVTFPDPDRSSGLLSLLLNNSLFQISVIALVVLLTYQIVIPKGPWNPSNKNPDS